MAAARPACVAVAFSGGRDSLALLHATCRAAAALGLAVVALHVHHGLLPEADDWLRWAQRLCARWRRQGWPLTLRWARLQGAPAPGESVEAWARAGRHQALAAMAAEAGASLLLLAQHRRDQAETVLLQALRGGGPAGLAAMPARAERAGLTWARPWLGHPREAIEAYVRRHRLKPVEDPSNADPRWARNRLRLQLWPALTQAFPEAEAALAGVALRAEEARAALAELAALDLAPLLDEAGRLQVAGWHRLSPARQANALRAWWRQQTGRSLAAPLLQRLLTEVPAQGAARWPAGGGWHCVLHRGRLQGVAGGALATPPGRLVLDLSRPGRWTVPAWGGAFEVAEVTGVAKASKLTVPAGLAPSDLCAVHLRARAGGERFQAHPGGPPRSLKKQYQQAGVPAHARGGPLAWSADGRLLYVPGLGADARAWPAAGAPRLVVRWCPEAAVPAALQHSG